MAQLLTKTHPFDRFSFDQSCEEGRKKPTKQMIDDFDRISDRSKKEGGTVLHAYWTIGRYDAIMTLEARDEKSAPKALIRWATCSVLRQCWRS